MTIRERMANGQLFLEEDPLYPEETADLAWPRQRSKTLCYEINRLHPDETLERTALMKQLFGHMGDASVLFPPPCIKNNEKMSFYFHKFSISWFKPRIFCF